MEMGIKNQKKFNRGWANCIISSCKERAKKKNVPFDIDASDLLDKSTGELPIYCPLFPHILLDYDAGPDRRLWASVDRTVPELGYTKGNVRVMSMAANIWKSNGSNATERLRIVEIMAGRTKKARIEENQPSLFDNL